MTTQLQVNIILSKYNIKVMLYLLPEQVNGDKAQNMTCVTF